MQIDFEGVFYKRSKTLPKINLDRQRMPKHIAIIMDGNGRWAKKRTRPRWYGHVRGSSIVKHVTRECNRLGIKALTLYAFSSENWQRPVAEVGLLMRMLKKYVIRERRELMEENVRMLTIGDISKLPPPVLEELNSTVELTKNNTGLKLVFAISYGSRQEIVKTISQIAEDVAKGLIKPDEISEEMINRRLETEFMPDPDLLIRTSGEMRVSNFLLWQIAYSELYITPRPWPEFDCYELHDAIASYQGRERRYGLTSEQLENQKQQ